MSSESATLIHDYQRAYERANEQPAPRISRDGADYVIHDNHIGWNNRRRGAQLAAMTARLVSRAEEQQR